tara:strand:+ start:466 stop:981 length:516 start_codon:yes stop_codon:yes gene_type:complete
MKNNTPFYSLWLVPKDPLKKEIQDINKFFSKKFGGPQFCPHVTLNPFICGPEKALRQQCLTFSRLFNPLEIRLENVSTTEKFFMSVFFDVHKSSQLMDMNKKSKALFESKEQLYVPHLSLTYGDFSFSEKNEMIGLSKVQTKSFVAEDLYLCLNDEAKLSWDVVDKFSFSS